MVHWRASSGRRATQFTVVWDTPHSAKMRRAFARGRAFYLAEASHIRHTEKTVLLGTIQKPTLNNVAVCLNAASATRGTSPNVQPFRN